MSSQASDSLRANCEDDLHRRSRRVVRSLHLLSKGRRPDPEQVHDLRTDVRRVDVHFPLLSEILPSKTGSRLRKELDSARKRAGDVRDLDILRSLILAEKHLPAKAKAWLLHRLDEQHEKASQKLARRCRKLLDDGIANRSRQFLRRLSDLKMTDQSSNRAIHQVYCKLIEEYFCYARRARTDWTQLHPLRKAIRTFRYASEALGIAANGVNLITELGAFQDLLGSANDSVMFLTFLRGAVDTSKLRQQSFTLPLCSLIERLDRDCTKRAQLAIKRVCQRTVLLKDAIERSSQQRQR